jgi:CubicO group peptidase (beta-lactamase class C family)
MRSDRASRRTIGFASDRLQRIGTALEREIANGTLPGCVVAIARRGELAFHEAFGFLDVGARVPMPKDAIFSIASMTKPVVTVGALMLYEEGRLMVNEPVGKYLPKLARMRVGIPGCDGSPDQTIDVSRDMTIQDLMRHTAGVSYGRGSTALHAIWPAGSAIAASKWTGGEFIDNIAVLPLHFQPGSAWEYSLGLDVLGLAIEAVVGKPLREYLSERLFSPLGMRDTGFVVPSAEVRRYARALPNDPLTGEPQTLRDGTRLYKFDCGGGCAVSTATDYLRFAQMLLNGGQLDGARLLSRKSVELMSDNAVGDLDLRNYPIEGQDLRGYGFGLGVRVRKSTGGSGWLGSVGDYGWAGANGTYFWIDPKEQLIGLVMMAARVGRLRTEFPNLVYQAIVD